MAGRSLTCEPTAADDVQCLVCGLWGQWLGTHVRRVHKLTAAEYRQRYDIPAGDGMASVRLRSEARERANTMIKDGVLTHDHLPRAVEAARAAIRRMSGTGRDRQRAAMADARPGDHAKLPPGAKRSDGRDAATARVAQQRRRAIKEALRRADAASDAEHEIRTIANDLADDS